MNSAAPFLPFAGIAAGLLCLWGSLRLRRKRRLIDDLPTAKTQGVFIGLVELKGTAESAAPLTGYLSGQRCVTYRFHVEEEWSRTVVVTHTDSKGNTTTETRRETGWTTVVQGGQTEDFYLQDDTGAVLVRPAGARLEPVTLFSQTCGRGDALYYAKGPPEAVPDSDHRRRFVETGIPLHAPLYLVGQARERADVVAPEIAADKEAPMYLISTRTEEKVRSGLGRGIFAFTVIGALLFPAGSVVRDLALERTLDAYWPEYAGLFGAFLALNALGWMWMAFNSLVGLRNRVNQAWSLVDVQLKRRHDLIPRLVEVIDALRAHEAGTQVAVASLRAQLEATPPGVAGPDFSGCAPVLRAVAEAYPWLKSDEAFLALQRQLVETEQRIALARSYFNDIATFLNTRLDAVPDRWIAALGRMQPQVLMGAADFERAPVPVKLAS